MIKGLLLFLIFFYGGCQTISHQDSGKKERYGPIDVPDSKWRVGDLVSPNLEVPDSLGGNRLRGFIALEIPVHKSGKLLGYKIRKILVALDTTKAPIEYMDLRPRVDVRTRSAQSDSLLRVFIPWVDQYYKSIKFTVNKDNPSFAQYDTLTMAHSIEFKGRKQVE